MAAEAATLRSYDFYLDWFTSPLIFGDYPVTMKRRVGSRMPAFTIQQSKQVKGAMEFIVSVKDWLDALARDLRDFNIDSGAQIEFKHVGDPPKSEALRTLLEPHESMLSEHDLCWQVSIFMSISREAKEGMHILNAITFLELECNIK
ncbi:hypothetical protein FXO38_19281 [Capsicum annuum]|nr:hypothetical protein FXO38_19281 [Capsicum annuum]